MTLVYVVAGEASGDVLGAKLMAALRVKCRGITFAGVGGTRMIDAGLKSLFPLQDLALMGFLEVLPHVLTLRERLLQVANDIAMRRPAVVVTIDSPGFMLRLLRRIKPLGIPRVHYVAPQVWAWRPSRAQRFPGLWEELLCLFPFEREFFSGFNLKAQFVGHPVLESEADRGNSKRFLNRHGLRNDVVPVILMPGSRESESRQLLPIFEKTLHLVAKSLPDLVPVMPVAPHLASVVAGATSRWKCPPIVVTDSAEKHDAFAAARAAVTKSGTSTLELALAGVPMVVAYRVNPITAALARHMITVPHVAIINLLAKKEIVPELLQQDCTPERLAQNLRELALVANAANDQTRAFPPLLSTLRPPSGCLPSEAAAEAVVGLLNASPR